MSALPPTDVLALYLEPLVHDARVVVVGSADSGAPELLLELGARSVHVFELDAVRAKQAAPIRGITVAMLPPHDFDVRDGAFDVALVPDLSALPDPPASLARLRRVLGAEGTILVAAPNPESVGRGIGYYELYDLVALQFATVKMIAAVPFSGTTLAELGVDGQPDVSVDTQLAGPAAPPLMFCAVASQREEIETSQYAIIQLPPSDEGPPLEKKHEKEEKTDPGVLVSLEAALAEARLRIEALEGKVKEQTSENKRKIRDVEGTLAEAQIRADQLEAELAEAHKLDRTADLEAAVAAAEERATNADALVAQREASIANLQVSLEAALADLAVFANAPKADAKADEEAAADVAKLEAQLRERATAFAEAQAEILRRDAMVKELLLTIEQQSAGAEDTGLREKLDALALELARRHGELEAARWRISELEQRIARPAVASSPKPASASTGADEVDALRQALVKEHQARTTAESGEALAQAQAEVQRQAVLIDQLSRDPSR
jgi:hypothetical protein